MHPEKQILCIHLPRWSITRCWRKQPESRSRAIVILHTAGNRRQVVQACDRAREMGVHEGMSAAEARAMCNPLMCIEQNPAADQRALIALGRWLMRFTPDVSSSWDEAIEDTPSVLFLDLTGCERLFGGMETILQQVRQAMNRFQIPAKMAIAPVPGAAWAFAYAGNRTDQIIKADSLCSAIQALTVNSLRLNNEITSDLFRLGLHQVGELLLIPREQLLSRFGPSVLNRLDQLTGERIEPLTKLVHISPITARMEFDVPIEAMENIGLIFEKLLGLVLIELTRRNRGVRQLRMLLKPDAGWGREMIKKTVALSRAHRDKNTLLHLMRCEIERIDCEHGFILFQLDIPLHELVTEAQIQLFEQQFAQEQMELERLFQRLRARLGEEAVIHPEPVESYLPERAWRAAKAQTAAVNSIYIPTRPLTLFQIPLEIRVLSEPSDDRTGHPRQFTSQGHVHRLTQITGPERIAGEWWRGHHRTRDYYDVEDQAGLRFWIFRVLKKQEEKTTVRWFLHGQFD